jgi:hypothetical protein
MRQREEQQRHAEQQARLNAMREEPVADEEPVPAATRYAPVAVEEAPAPSLSDDEDTTNPNQILKCRDASGAVTFTQGYCPPGTKRVDMPKSE